MAKKKSVKVKYANARFIEITSKQLIRIEVSDGFFGPVKWKFFVPLSTKDKFGFIPREIVNARMLRDFNIEIEHYSSTLGYEE